MALIDKLTAIANKIRTLDGTTSKLSHDEMAESVDTANTDIATQSELIAQIQTALEGKAGLTGIKPYIKELVIDSELESYIGNAWVSYCENGDILVTVETTDTTLGFGYFVLYEAPDGVTADNYGGWVNAGSGLTSVATTRSTSVIKGVQQDVILELGLAGTMYSGCSLTIGLFILPY